MGVIGLSGSFHFQTDIQKNKDWNLDYPICVGCICRLSDWHPKEQGLKHPSTTPSDQIFPRFQTDIQKNKDWNILGTLIVFITIAVVFQTDIQKNKDWNRTEDKDCLTV